MELNCNFRLVTYGNLQVKAFSFLKKKNPGVTLPFPPMPPSPSWFITSLTTTISSLQPTTNFANYLFHTLPTLVWYESNVCILLIFLNPIFEKTFFTVTFQALKPAYVVNSSLRTPLIGCKILVTNQSVGL